MESNKNIQDNPSVDATLRKDNVDKPSTDGALIVGLKLYRPIYNRNNSVEINEVVISKIGKKYFYLEGYEDRYPILKEELKYVSRMYYQHNFQLYRTRQEILDEQEHKVLFQKLRKEFDGYWNCKLTLEQLREAAKILNIN